MNKPKVSSISYNSFLSFANHILFFGTVLFYSFYNPPKLVNWTTLLLYGMLYVQTILILRYEAKRPNPFILILVYLLTAYYFPRIITLYFESQLSISEINNFSVLNRLRPSTVNDLNYTLTFIFAANLSMFLGWLFADKKVNKLNFAQKTNAINKPRVNPVVIIILTVVSIFSSFYFSFFAKSYSANYITSYINLILNPLILIQMILVYLFYVYYSGRGNESSFFSWTKRRYSVLLVGLLILVFLLRIIVGSRSSTISVVQGIFLVSLTLGIYRVPRKILLLCLLLLALSFPLFTISTTSRQLKSVTSDTTNLEEQFIQTIELSGSAFRSRSLVSILAPSFSRASFLDMSLDLIKNCNNYRQIINPIFYSKSIIDNALTPGAVDFFDTPKAANALKSIYGNISNISLRSTRISYQSDQMNIYGEFFVLFYGWFSMPAFFLFTYFFQVIFFHNLNREKFDYGRSVLDIFWMNVFFSVLISFGIDWIIGDTIQSYITTRMMLFFIKTRIRL